MVKPVSAEDIVATIVANNRKPLKSFWRGVSRTARSLKAGAIRPEEKNRLWSIHSFADATATYLDAYHLMARGKFQKGWCVLEQAEIGFLLQTNNSFVEQLAPLVERRAELVALWQSLFPYRHFASPGMRYKRWACSICGKQSTPVEPCGHIPNRIYAGEQCYRKILEAEPLEVSIVTNPVQKYSVLQLDYDYSVVRYVLDHLANAFQPWDGEWTHRRYPHAQFAGKPHDGPCPCSSQLRYNECCLREDGVRLPHFQMIFHRRYAAAREFVDQVVVQPAGGQTGAADGLTFRANILRASV